MKVITLLFIFSFGWGIVYGQTNERSRSETTLERITIQYKGKERKGVKISVTTLFPYTIEKFWEAEQLIEHTKMVTQPMTKLQVIQAPQSPYFIEDSTYILKPLSYGLFPIGGEHTIYIEEINHDEYYIQTREYNTIARVWDHRLSWEESDGNQVIYTDTIELYAGVMTPIFALYLRSFYKMRHKNWYALLKKL